jgi:hypothetical protein
MKAEASRPVIGTLSKQTGCNVETIRYYERVGLHPGEVLAVTGSTINPT